MKKALLIIITYFFWFSDIYALDIYGVYTGNCERELGTIINVKDQSFDILTISGFVKTIPRYQAIYLAAYPIDYLPVSKFSTSTKTELYSIKSKDGKKIKPLLKGWAINFTEDQVSFLTTKRDEVLVEKVDLWKIEKENRPINFKSESAQLKSIQFFDPYPFAHCERPKETIKIIPQKLFSDAVDIKKEFDRLQLGHLEMSKFMRRQRFYPRPEIYQNSSILGLWLMTGARYGASDSRANNFSPFLRNEFSSGAYSYQHLITTGSGPIMDGTHTDTQTHFYYRMKAEYIHISLMADPNLLLVGNQYDWKSSELNAVDFRMNESFFMELGFDYGNLSFEFSPAMKLHTAVKFGNEFRESADINLNRFGLRYTALDCVVNGIFGQGSQDNGFDYKNKINLFRLNFQKQLNDNQEFTASFINKTARGTLNSNSFDYTSNTLSGIYTHRYKERIYFSGLLGIEIFDVNSTIGATDFNQSKTAFTFGLNSSLKF